MEHQEFPPQHQEFPMEPQKLPNATTALVLSILSIVLCCTAIGGVIFSVIALVLTSKDKKTYEASPENYSNYSQVKTAKIIAIIGLILSAYMIFSFISALYQYGGWEGFMDYVKDTMEEAQNQAY